MFKKIKSKYGALTAIKDSCIIFVAVSFFNIIFAFINSSPMIGIRITDSLINLTLAYILFFWNSKTIAVVLLLQSAGGFIFLSYRWLFDENQYYDPRPVIILSLILTWAAIRAVQATYLLHSKYDG